MSDSIYIMGCMGWIAIAMQIMGLILLFAGRIPRMPDSELQGPRARYTGLALLLYYPVTFFCGLWFRVFNSLTNPYPPGPKFALLFTQVTVAFGIVFTLLLAVTVAHVRYPRTRDRQSKMIPIAEAASRVGLSQSAIRGLIKKGVLKSVTVIDQEEIDLRTLTRLKVSYQIKNALFTLRNLSPRVWWPDVPVFTALAALLAGIVICVSMPATAEFGMAVVQTARAIPTGVIQVRTVVAQAQTATSDAATAVKIRQTEIANQSINVANTRTARAKATGIRVTAIQTLSNSLSGQILFNDGHNLLRANPIDQRARFADSVHFSDDIRNAEWSSDAKRIMFTRSSSGGQEVVIADIDGTNLRRLQGPASGSLFDPVWSPNNRSIAVAFSPSSTGHADIYVVDVNGSTWKRLTFEAEDARVPSWSADGKYIAYCAWKNRKADIYIMQIDGFARHRLTYATSDRKDNCYPVWSPDGQRLAFVATAKGQRPSNSVYVVNTDDVITTDSNVRPREYFDIKPGEKPSWSPNGQWLAACRSGSGK